METPHLETSFIEKLKERNIMDKLQSITIEQGME